MALLSSEYEFRPIKNRWRQIDSTLWQCFNFDVCFHFGSWHICTVYGRTIKDGFTSAEQAIHAANQIKD